MIVRDNLIRNNIEVEYEHMRRNDSLVADLYERLYSLTDLILVGVDTYLGLGVSISQSLTLHSLPVRPVMKSSLLRY